jgi:hypothetical protein
MANDNSTSEALSPQPSARTIGTVWFLYFVTALLGGYLTRGLVVTSDAAATAQNILAHAGRYRAAISFDLVANSIYIALTALLYGLFRPVNRSVALTAAFLSLAGCIVQITGDLLRLAPSIFLTNSALSRAFNPQQLQAATVVSLGLYNAVFQLSFILFAFFWLCLGYLILSSRFLPRFLGWWWIFGGLAWLTELWPPLATTLRPILIVGILAELALPLWLLVKGVDVAHWRDLARDRP